MKYTFNWHKAKEDDFLKWAIVNMISDARSRDEGNFDVLSEATEQWKKVELGITLNGIEVDAKAFMKNLDRSREALINRLVAEKMSDIPELEELDDTIRQFRMGVEEKMHQIAAKHGIEIPERW